MLDSIDFATPRWPEPVRPLSVFATAVKRRVFPPDMKARLVAESFTSGDSVCAVARRHHLSASQLYAWRKAARLSGDAPPREAAAARKPSEPEPRAEARRRDAARIEIAIGSAIVRVPHGIDPATLKLVLEALREAQA
jgi:transposase